MSGFAEAYERVVYEWLPVGASFVALFGAVGTTIHVLLYKRNERAAIGWIGLVWLSPFLGFLVYILLGVNRVRRLALELRAESTDLRRSQDIEGVSCEDLRRALPEGQQHLAAIARVVDTDAWRAVLAGNQIEPLFAGDEAYPAMIEAIDQAAHSVHMMAYIFDNDSWGKRFVDAMARARDRGVEVRVLIDAAGARYSLPPITSVLRRAGIDVCRFNPATLIPPRIITINLRNHRKVMVVDGEVGFTGGINIRESCVLADNPSRPTSDLHFRVRGPTVAHLQEAFVEDWAWAAREKLDDPRYFPRLREVGTVFARGISDGPDEDIDKLRWALLAAIGAAQRNIRIVTPYFIPDESIRESLVVAAKRGVQIDVVLPEHSNLAYVDWASRGHVGVLLDHHINVVLVGPPFEHGKMMVVDEGFVMLGSANWDPRSLRLNFEFNLECYDPVFAAKMDAWAVKRRDSGEAYTAEMHRARGWGRRMLHSASRLMSPYL